MTEVPAEARNTREVFPIRLSGAERAQIEGAAKRRELTIAGFVRQAALQASAVVRTADTSRLKDLPALRRVVHRASAQVASSLRRLHAAQGLAALNCSAGGELAWVF